MRLHLAEFLLAILFIAGGFSTLRDPKPRAAQLARLGFPFADLSVRVNAALMVVAGLALAINYYPAAASVVLAILLIPTTVFGHAFWLEKGHERQVQLSHFVKNLGVLAGLLLRDARRRLASANVAGTAFANITWMSRACHAWEATGLTDRHNVDRNR